MPQCLFDQRLVFLQGLRCQRRTGTKISAEKYVGLLDTVHALHHRQVIADKLAEGNLLKAALQIDRYTAIGQLFGGQIFAATISEAFDQAAERGVGRRCRLGENVNRNQANHQSQHANQPTATFRRFHP